jgi:Na+/proline symporter
MTTPILITFAAYFVILLGIGLYFTRRHENIEGYRSKRMPACWGSSTRSPGSCAA